MDLASCWKHRISSYFSSKKKTFRCTAGFVKTKKQSLRWKNFKFARITHVGNASTWRKPYSYSTFFQATEEMSRIYVSVEKTWFFFIFSRFSKLWFSSRHQWNEKIRHNKFAVAKVPMLSTRGLAKAVAIEKTEIYFEANKLLMIYLFHQE